LVKPHEFSVVDVHGFYLLFYETRPPAWHYRIGINRTTTAEIASFAWFFVHGLSFLLQRLFQRGLDHFEGEAFLRAVWFA
jgi:hypothetical protein